MLYPIVKNFFKLYFKIAFRVQVEGRENIPKTGAAVLCCNHTSNYDPIGMAIYIDRLPRYIAKKELFENPIMNKALLDLKAFPIDRSAAMDMKAFKKAVSVLKEGEMLGIFAEGRRVKEGEKADAKGGVALFALKGNSPVIPVAISSKYKFRSKVVVRYGKPISLEAYQGKKVDAAMLQEIADMIMEKIEELKEKTI